MAIRLVVEILEKQEIKGLLAENLFGGLSATIKDLETVERDAKITLKRVKRKTSGVKPRKLNPKQQAVAGRAQNSLNMVSGALPLLKGFAGKPRNAGPGAIAAAVTKAIVVNVLAEFVSQAVRAAQDYLVEVLGLIENKRGKLAERLFDSKFLESVLAASLADISVDVVFNGKGNYAVRELVKEGVKKAVKEILK